MKKNKSKTALKNKKTASRAQSKSKSFKKPTKAIRKTTPKATSKKAISKTISKKTGIRTSAKLSKASPIKTKKKMPAPSLQRPASRLRPIEAQTEERFRDIMDQENLHNTADAGEVFDSHEYKVMPRITDLDEPGDLDDTVAPEDTVSAMERAEDEDTIATGELVIPERTEELAIGDDEEDSDEPNRLSKPDYENI